MASGIVDLDQLITEILCSYVVDAQPKPEICIHRPLLSVIAHEPSLLQCLSNQIGNALKFVPAGTIPQVKIRTQRVDDHVRIWG